MKGLPLIFALIASAVVGGLAVKFWPGSSPTGGSTPASRRIAVPISNIAQLALLQEKELSVDKLMATRKADALASTTTYKLETLSVGICCPCPDDTPIAECQCDAFEYSRQYMSHKDWNASMQVADSTGKVDTSLKFDVIGKEGDLIFYRLPKLKQGSYELRITASFDGKNPYTYNTFIKANEKGAITYK